MVAVGGRCEREVAAAPGNLGRLRVRWCHGQERAKRANEGRHVEKRAAACAAQLFWLRGISSSEGDAISASGGRDVEARRDPRGLGARGWRKWRVGGCVGRGAFVPFPFRFACAQTQIGPRGQPAA